MPLTTDQILKIESQKNSELLMKPKCRVAVVFASETKTWHTLIRSEICSGDVDPRVLDSIETPPTVWSKLDINTTTLTLGSETRIFFGSSEQQWLNTSSLTDRLADCEGLVLVYNVMDWLGYEQVQTICAYVHDAYSPESPMAPSTSLSPQQEQEATATEDAEPQLQKKKTDPACGRPNYSCINVLPRGLSRSAENPLFRARPVPFPIAIVGNCPSSTQKPWVITKDEGTTYAEKIGASFHVVSAARAEYGDYNIMDELASRILLRRAFGITNSSMSKLDWNTWFADRQSRAQARALWPRSGP